MNRLLGVEGKYPIIDLFPYKIKDINLFLFRDHIPYNKENPVAVRYAREQWKRIVEGHWVYDKKPGEDEGTWVFMMPKLYFLANFVKISLEDDEGNRFEEFASVWDNHWLLGSYTLCFDGFSGFDKDPDVTCNIDVKRIEDGEELTPYELEQLKNQYVLKEDGTYKKYIEAWEYLTSYYLCDNPRPFPLGNALYWNAASHGMILASRKASKTVWDAAADMIHEFNTNGVRQAKWLDPKKRKSKVSIFVASYDTTALSTFMTIAETSWLNMPGAEPGGVSPFFRNAEGQWTADRAKITQGYRPVDGGKLIGSGSEIANAIIQVNKAAVTASRRTRRIYVTEVGLVKNIKAFLAAAKGTTKATGKQSGSVVMEGTGGDIVAIQETKEVANNPIQFGVYPIPNYWEGGEPFVFFMPVQYTEHKYKDPNGNTDLVAATKGILKDRIKLSGGDFSKITAERQNFPMVPQEMFIEGKNDWFAKDIIADRIMVLEENNKKLWRAQVKLYDLELGLKEGNGVFDVRATEHNRWDNVIFSSYGTATAGKTGELVVIEEPKPNPTPFAERDNLYKVVLDPVTDKQTGRSFQGLIVIKEFPRGRALEPGELVNTIVASFKGRRSDQDNKKLALCLCIWYKANLQYENNTPGTHDFFYKHGMVGLLQPPPWGTIKNYTPGTKESKDTGVAMNEILKGFMMRELKTFHTMTVRRDDNARNFCWIEDCYDLALLYEMLEYQEKSNVDLISAMLIYMVWLQSEYKPEILGGVKQSTKDFIELAEYAEELYDW